ncbi:GbsR/MarR family transcriptional regulator [Paracoccaceae bacterium GXU_MW_L88]
MMSEPLRSDFIEIMGEIAQADGHPPISGRILGLMIYDGQARSFSEIAEQLHVSRGSVSENTRRLEALGVLERFREPGDRRDFYRLPDDAFRRLAEGYAERAADSEARVNAVREAVQAEDPACAARLGRLAGFYGAVSAGVAVSLSRLCAESK